jgi:SAM-dependent methyltransferase
MKRVTAVATHQAEPEWFESWFDSAHYHRLYAHRDQSEADAFVDRLIDRLGPAAGARMLDLGCGSGRHARRLAAHGHRVTGIDLSAGSLARARAERGPYVRFVQQDMREPFGRGVFDVVFSLFTSFGYFHDRADHAVVIRNVATALHAGGVLVLDYLNARHVEQHLVPSEVVVRDGVRYHLTRWRTASAFFKRIEIADPVLPAPLEYVERVARLTLADFERMLAAEGLIIEACYGDYQLAPFDANSSPRLIIVARRSPARQVLADPAQRLGRDAEERGQHRLRHPLDDRGVGGKELQVAFLGRRAQGADDALVLGGVVTLQAVPERGAVRGHRVDEPLVRGSINQQELGILDRLDEVWRGRPCAEAVGISQPPGLGGELDDVLLPLRVDDVVAQATRGNERRVARNVAGPLQKLPGGQPPVEEGSTNDLEVSLVERGPGQQIGTQHVER